MTAEIQVVDQYAPHTPLILHAVKILQAGGVIIYPTDTIYGMAVDMRHKAAIEKLDWYAMRWKIETFHKILKSGCRAEDARLRTAERLTNLIALYSIVSWRVFWITMLARVAPQAPATVALSELEIQLLEKMIKDAGKPVGRKTLGTYLIKLARLGGYLARASDPPPGNMVIWRGLSRLADIQLGAAITAESCG